MNQPSQQKPTPQNPGNKQQGQTGQSGQQTQQGNKDKGGYSSPGHGSGSGQSAPAEKK